MCGKYAQSSSQNPQDSRSPKVYLGQPIPIFLLMEQQSAPWEVLHLLIAANIKLQQDGYRSVKQSGTYTLLGCDTVV